MKKSRTQGASEKFYPRHQKAPGKAPLAPRTVALHILRVRGECPEERILPMRIVVIRSPRLLSKLLTRFFGIREKT